MRSIESESYPSTDFLETRRDSERRRKELIFVGVYLGGGKLRSGEYKANVFFSGNPTASRIINAFIETPEIQRIVALVPDEEFISSFLSKTDKQISFLKAGVTFAESAKEAFLAVFPEENVIVVLSDVPFIKSSSLSRLARSELDQEAIIPAVFKRDVEPISELHNLHFNPSKEGYFHLGSSILLKKEARDKIDLERMNIYYKGKSFRTDPRAKLEAVYRLAGIEGILVAVRIWLSANLQHKGLQNLDKIIPSPQIEAYQRIISRIFGIPTGLMFGYFGDLFLDFDYPDDAELLEKNMREIEEFMNEHVKS